MATMAKSRSMADQTAETPRRKAASLLSDATENWRIRQLGALQAKRIYLPCRLGELTETTVFSEEASRRAAESTALWTRVAEENAAAARMVRIEVDELSGGFGAALPPIMAMTFEQQQAAEAARLLGELYQ